MDCTCRQFTIKKWLLRNEALQRVRVDDGDDERPEGEDLADGLRGKIQGPVHDCRRRLAESIKVADHLNRRKMRKRSEGKDFKEISDRKHNKDCEEIKNG